MKLHNLLIPFVSFAVAIPAFSGDAFGIANQSHTRIYVDASGRYINNGDDPNRSGDWFWADTHVFFIGKDMTGIQFVIKSTNIKCANGYPGKFGQVVDLYQGESLIGQICALESLFDPNTHSEIEITSQGGEYSYRFFNTGNYKIKSSKYRQSISGNFISNLH